MASTGFHAISSLCAGAAALFAIAAGLAGTALLTRPSSKSGNGIAGAVSPPGLAFATAPAGAAKKNGSVSELAAGGAIEGTCWELQMGGQNAASQFQCVIEARAARKWRGRGVHGKKMPRTSIVSNSSSDAAVVF